MNFASDNAAGAAPERLIGSAEASLDLPFASPYAEAALSLDPALREAAFNRGLALKALGRVEEARRVFASMAGSGDAWSNAARDELRDLEGAGPGRP